MAPVTCLVCYEDVRVYSSLACGHKYCNECYTQFLTHKIKDEGHEAIFVTCPEPKVTNQAHGTTRNPTRTSQPSRVFRGADACLCVVAV